MLTTLWHGSINSHLQFINFTHATFILFFNLWELLFWHMRNFISKDQNTVHEKKTCDNDSCEYEVTYVIKPSQERLFRVLFKITLLKIKLY